MNIDQVAMAIRYWADENKSAVNNFLSIAAESEHSIKRRDAVLPTALGAGIVMGVSLLERLANDKLSTIRGEATAIRSMTDLDWVRELGLTLRVGTLEELRNFVRLRHCFAHEYGRATARQLDPLNDYLERLKSGQILDEKDAPIPPYYEITNQGTISLLEGASNRLRLTLWYTVEQIERVT